MSQTLEQAVAELRARASQSGALPRAENIKCTEDSFSFVVVRQDGRVRVECSLLHPEEWPHSPCVLCCDGGSALSPEEQLAIEALGESHFSKTSQVQEVVSKVLQVFCSSGGSEPQRLEPSRGTLGGAIQPRVPAQHDSTEDVHMTSAASAASDLMDIDTVRDEEEEEEEAGSMEDDDYNQGSDSEAYSHEDDDEDRELMIECGKRQGRWERFEATWQEAQEEQAMSAEQASVKKQQIFDRKEAFLRLSRELLEIIKMQSVYMFADSEGDDVYTWAVELSGFEAGSGLAADMADVRKRYNYSSVQLKLHFMRDLHPFYPARVELVRPHFKHWAHGALASHPLLQLANWDPLRPQVKLIEQIKSFLESHARVDLGCPLNDISLYPRSSYRPVQAYLANLEALSGFSPLCVSGDDQDASPDAQRLYEARVQSAMQPADSGPADSGGAAGTGAAPGRKRGRAGKGETGSTATGGTATGGTATTTATEPETYWARGTGYGTGSRTNEVWDNQASAAAQGAQDREMMRVMSSLARALQHELGPLPPYITSAGPEDTSQPTAGPSTSSPEQPAASTRRAVTRSRSRAPASTSPPAAAPTSPPRELDAVEVLEAQMCAELVPAASASESQAEQSYSPDPGSCQEALVASCLIPVLAHELRVTSFSDMCDRQTYYTCLMRLLMQLCRPECAQALLLRQVPGQAAGTSLASCIAKLKHASQQFIKLTRATLIAKLKEEEQAKAAAAVQQPQSTTISSETAARIAAASAAQQARVQAQVEDSVASLRASMYLALLASKLCSACEEAVARGCGGNQQGAAAGTGGQQACWGTNQAAALAAGGESGGGPSSSGADRQSPEAEYMTAMRPLQVLMVEDLTQNHQYSAHLAKEMSQPSERIIRLGKEIAGLSTDLALSTSSSVFVAVDETNMMLWRCVITGPDDTPYSCGCFVFDMYFPPLYPSVAPLVNLRTTGGGSVRFNPNLYNCGKVCLSLLGTWSGGKGEGWMAGVSTANQVLLSIQSLIFVEQPYFNEPGYEKEMNTAKGKSCSAAYNQNIREATVRYAMLDVLRHPKPEFAEVVKLHFRLRREFILEQVTKWVADASSSSKHAHSMAHLLTDLKTELAKL